MSKIDDLKEAYEANSDKWKQYENDCHRFFKQFHLKLMNYLGCSNEQVIWTKISDEFRESIDAGEDEDYQAVNPFSDMILGQDGYWFANFMIYFERSSKGGWIRTLVKVKRVDDYYEAVFMGQGQPIEISIRQNYEEDWISCCQQFYNGLLWVLNTDFASHIYNNGFAEKPHSLGFRMPDISTPDE